jgi:cytochrome c556
MSRARFAAVAVALGALLPTLGLSQGDRKGKQPMLEAVAETQLLMEGLALPNFRGLEKILRGKPADAEAWSFARGQALLLAETGNLLMLRPPRNQGRDAWMERSAELRDGATKLARFAGARDLLRCREALVQVAGTCNRCHETFRVVTRIRVFAEAAE